MDTHWRYKYFLNLFTICFVIYCVCLVFKISENKKLFMINDCVYQYKNYYLCENSVLLFSLVSLGENSQKWK